MSIIKNVSKVSIFFLLSIVLAFTYTLSHQAYYIAGCVLLFIFIKRPLSLILIIFFIASNFYVNSYFIVISTTNIKGKVTCYSSKAIITINDNVSIKAGDIIIGGFKKTPTTFYRARYINEGSLKVIEVPIISKVLNFRDTFSEHLFYVTAGRVSVGQALIFGDRRFIADNTRDEYTISGLAHLLAMSGMHVGIIIAIFLTLLFFLPIKIRMIIAIFAVLSLQLFGAFSITVVRATIFSIFFMLTYIFDINIDRRRFLQFIVAIFLIFSPTSATDISFLLSFGAVFGIIYFVDKGYNNFFSIIYVGVAATILTAPLSLYFFNMTNHLSILSTVIMSPIIYLHILFAILATFSPIFIPPLVAVESFSNYIVSIINSCTYFGFILKEIPKEVLFGTMIFAILALLSRYKWLSVLALLVIFYPAYNEPAIIFPALKGADKGFMVFTDNRTEIFYQGSPSGFKYNFLPVIAKYGITKFDYGNIRIFSGKNNYIKIKDHGKDFTNICVNVRDDNCKIIYHTRSNSVKAKDIDDNITHIIYKNKFKDKSIIEINEHGEYITNAEH